MLTVNEFFTPETGLIAKAKKNFAPRDGQVELSRLIYGAINSELHVIAEAETGFGKSFAVLVPAIVQALENNKRVVISTETLALQDQYIYKDLPLLQKACQKAGANFYFAVAKGKSNYVCRLKVNEDDRPDATPLMKWAANLSIEDSGDVSDITFEFEPQEWHKIACDEDCTKKACPFYGAGSNVEKGETECFVYQARRNYNEAQIVVANHTLVLLDAQLGAGTLLGPYDVLIVDEAHSMPERAQDAWGTTIRPQSISKTIVKISTMLGRINHRLPNDNLGFFKDMEQRLFAHFNAVVQKGYSVPMNKVHPQTVKDAGNEAAAIIIELKKLGRDINAMLDGNSDESPIGQAVAQAKESLSGLVGSLNKIFGDADPEYADNWLTFVEVSNMSRGGKQGVLHVKPIEVAPLMRGMLIDKVPTCIFLSATMKVKGSFSFMRKELGLPYDKTQEFEGKSPFDFSKVTAYCPRTLPSCDRDNEDEYLDKIAQECIAIIKKMQGRTMVLFTNATHMKKIFYRVQPNVRYQMFLQGQMSKNATLDQFRENIEFLPLCHTLFYDGHRRTGGGFILRGLGQVSIQGTLGADVLRPLRKNQTKWR